MTLPLLCEGYNPDWTVAFVNSQGAVFRQNESCTGLMTESGDSLSFHDGRLIVESSGEDIGNADIVSIQGTFQREGVPNANKRTYKSGTFSRLLGEGTAAYNCIKSRAMCGHLEHPADGITDLKKIAIVVVECKVQPDGTVWGKADVLKTIDGMQARALLEGGVRIGISSRGRGTVGPGGIVNDDYILETFDLVYNPSTPGAHPKPLSLSTHESVSESAGTPLSSKELPMSFDFAAFETRVRPLIEQDITTLATYQKGEVSARLLEATQQAMAAIKADPSQSITLAPLVQQMQEKRKALTDGGVNEAKVLEERVEELSAALTEAQEAATEQKAAADAGVELAEALVAEFNAKLADINESVDDESDDEGEDVEIEEEAVDEAGEVEALREALAVSNAKYVAACAIIEELTKKPEDKTPAVDPIKESIAELVKKHPFLSESVSLLESQTSVEQVAKVAEVLVKTAVAAGYKIEESKTTETKEVAKVEDAKVDESADASRPKGKTVESDGASSTATLTESATQKKPNTRASLIRALGNAGKFG